MKASAVANRSLERGFNVLEVANLNNGARLRDFVRITDLPKSTTFRILENLRRAGYLRRDDNDDRYYLTPRVRRLSDGHFDGGWISEIARPVLKQLAETVRFPVAIATPYGAAMMLRDNTDAESPLAPNVYPRGTPLPLLTSATGKVYLAFCDDMTRKTLLAVCAESGLPEHNLAHHGDLLNHSLETVRRQGYAFGPGGRQSKAGVETATIAVPILAKGHLIGAMALRFLSATMKRQTVVERYLKIMNQHSRLIGRRVATSSGVVPGP
jgi:IclR family mhp operon transcriptional activator